MGQWSTRARRGCKKSPPTIYGEMVVAQKVASAQIRVTYNQNVFWDIVDAQDYLEVDESTNGNAIDVLTPNSAIITFDDPVIDGDTLRFTGAQGLLNGQEIVITL